MHKWLTGRRALLPVLLLAGILLFMPDWSGATAGKRAPEPRVSFLNDRAAAIVGAAPLAAPGFVTPGGLTGAGEVVAIADSGLGNGDMSDPVPDLKSAPGQKPKVIMLKSWAGRARADDPLGHGTHMAATIAGTGAASDGRYAGLAPGANLYFESILNAAGKIDPPADLTSLFTPAYAADARIHVDGWGTETNAYLSGAAQTDAFVRQHPDFLVIFGAGNSGPAAGTLTAEANSKDALVVGASESVRPSFGPDSDNAAKLAPFSSRGPTADGRVKPDLVAPGTAIISACSPLIKGNLPGDPDYTRMSGTSMAAAVAGGAAVLLRQYFGQTGVPDPSAALMKAALINGADPVSGGGAGFGRLDLAQTVLSLQQKAFAAVDERNPLTRGDRDTYYFKVSDPARPFKATLAWTDPPSVPGAARTLINDLNLVVETPDGHFVTDSRDANNNVQQVVIPHPVPGTYAVIAKAARISRGVAPGAAPGQDFALVYGQPLAQKTILNSDVQNNRLYFTDGSEAAFPDTGHIALGRETPPWNLTHALPGTIAYMVDGSPLYLAGEVWKQQAADVLPLASGTLLQEADPQHRNGGYYIDPRADNPLQVNDQPARPGDVPPGVRIWASVDPLTQTAWRAWAWFREENGVISAVDAANHRLYLLGHSQPYLLDENTVYAFDDTLTGSSPADLPFGEPAAGSLSGLAAGMKVRLMLAGEPENRVAYLGVQRDLAVGTVAAVDGGNNTVRLAGGGSFRLMPGLHVDLDGRPAGMPAIQPGRYASLLLSGNLAIGASIYDQTTYGQVVYYKQNGRDLLLLDYQNHMHSLAVTPQTRFFRWGRPGDINNLMPGEWVRVALAPDGVTALRVDTAEAAGGGKAGVTSVNTSTGLVTFSTGEKALLTPYTLVTKNSYPVQPEDIRPGEPAEFISLAVPAGGTPSLATLKARSRPGVPAPSLQASIRLQGLGLLVAGRTSGNIVYVYPEQGSPVKAGTDGRGDFEALLNRPAGGTVQVVAVDRRTGGVVGEYLTVPGADMFSDLRGHWAAKEIGSLVENGLLNGYPDGKFYPDRPVTRAEFTVMLARALGWSSGAENSAGTKAGPAVLAPDLDRTGAPGADSGGDGGGTPAGKAGGPMQTAADAADSAGPGHGTAPAAPADRLPAWAAGAIKAALTRGVISGYPDGTFRPDQPVTRLEAAGILARVLEVTGLVKNNGEPPAGASGGTSATGAAQKGTAGTPVNSGGSGTVKTTGTPPHGGTDAAGAAGTNSADGGSPAGGGNTGGRNANRGGNSASSSDSFILPSYADAGAIPAWARTSVALVARFGLMAGDPGQRFDPAGPLTRAQAAVIIYRLRLLMGL
ncbi:S-layer homology domain-containing protein [Desulfotomaculum copahuensis]|uniref:SLH domain-containing protein n=1 Tax=Desulfotomaculum copahuensis TaxID=1838280 RepID=A0A1B7LBB6_9FIRM|nr:S-layer homology domain-containing protein [Desulfotomaculum copahuensis]OAT79793.1 hypothetical protein A6M21_15205 [Desulfotomaculum copahuensis]